MTFVDPILELSFDTQPLSTVNPAEWTDVTTDARRPLTIRRGRSRSLDQPTAGSLSIDLDNRAGNYDPDNSTGPHSGFLIPDVPARVSAVHDGTTYRLFRGSVDGWPQRWSEGGDFDASVPLSAHDHFKMLSLPEIGTPYDDAVTNTSGLVAYWKLDESSGTTAVDSATANSTLNGTYTNGPTLGATGPFVGGGRPSVLFGSSSEKEFVDLGNSTTLHLGSAFTVECWFQTTNSSTTSQRLYRARLVGVDLGLHRHAGAKSTRGGRLFVSMWNTTGEDTFFLSAGTTKKYNDGLWHHAVLAYSGSTAVLFVDGRESARSPLAGPVQYDESGGIAIARDGNADHGYFPGRIDEVAIYDRALTQQEVSAHYALKVDSFSTERSDQRIGRILDFAGLSTSTNARDLRQGQTNLSSDDADDSAALDYIRRCAQSENGVFFIAGDGKATFHDRHYRLTQQTTPEAVFGDLSSELPYADLELGLDDEDIANTVTVSRDGGSTATVFSTGSIDNHGRRLLERSNLLMADDNEAQSAAEWLLTKFADPNTRVRSITLKPHGSTALWPEVLGREIGDHIVVKRRPPGGNSTISKSLHVESIEHRVSEKTWVTRIECSPLDGTNYLVLNSTAQGVLNTDRLGY